MSRLNDHRARSSSPPKRPRRHVSDATIIIIIMVMVTFSYSMTSEREGGVTGSVVLAKVMKVCSW